MNNNKFRQTYKHIHEIINASIQGLKNPYKKEPREYMIFVAKQHVAMHNKRTQIDSAERVEARTNMLPFPSCRSMRSTQGSKR